MRTLIGRGHGLTGRLGWLLGAGLLCCLLGLMGAATLESSSSSTETAGTPVMALPAGNAVSVAELGAVSVLPVCARLPVNDRCFDADQGDPADPEAIFVFRQLLPGSPATPAKATHPTLAQATRQPLLRPPRSQG